MEYNQQMALEDNTGIYSYNTLFEIYKDFLSNVKGNGHECSEEQIEKIMTAHLKAKNYAELLMAINKANYIESFQKNSMTFNAKEEIFVKSLIWKLNQHLSREEEHSIIKIISHIYQYPHLEEQTDILKKIKRTMYTFELSPLPKESQKEEMRKLKETFDQNPKDIWQIENLFYNTFKDFDYERMRKKLSHSLQEYQELVKDLHPDQCLNTESFEIEKKKRKKFIKTFNKK